MMKPFGMFLAMMLACTTIAGNGQVAEQCSKGLFIDGSVTPDIIADSGNCKPADKEAEKAEKEAEKEAKKAEKEAKKEEKKQAKEEKKQAKEEKKKEKAASKENKENGNRNKDQNVTLNVTEHDIAPGSTPETNPLKGLIPFATSTSFPHSMEWFYIAVNEVEVSEGVYDWTALEKRLEPIAERGHQAVLRFYYDYPGENSGVPQYLIDDYGLEMKPYNEPDDLGGAGLCPDYSNEHFRKSMQNFIAAFGEKYDGDPRIGFITEGLLGFWGEWHNWPFDEDTSDGKPNWNIPAEVYTEVYAAFDDAFDITQLVVREPKDGVDNASYATGYHDDSFAYSTLSVANGGQDWSFMQRLKNHDVQNNWQIGCIGGEVYPPLQGEIFKDNPVAPDWAPIQDWNKCVSESHASWLMCDQIKGYRGSTKEHAINASKGLGYDLQVTKAFYSDTIGKDTGLPVKVEIKNNGIAPFYYDHNTWSVMIGVKKGDDLIKKWETDWDLPDVKYGENPALFQTTIDKHGLGDGTYNLCIKVKNPLEGGVLFHFANKNELSGGWLDLGTFTVKGAGIIDNKPIEDDFGPGE